MNELSLGQIVLSTLDIGFYFNSRGYQVYTFLSPCICNDLCSISYFKNGSPFPHTVFTNNANDLHSIICLSR